uniref:C-type lectin domain-containing protein n=1 Tax=Sander lucioperca TaxID=283035 RepID=A0A8D0CSC9_SANLU
MGTIHVSLSYMRCDAVSEWSSGLSSSPHGHRVRIPRARSTFFCQSAGGHLASINSDAEHRFIRYYIKQVTGENPPAWIGGHDLVQEGIWMWTDGSQFYYQSWGGGEPNNCCGGENCLLINWRDNWNDGTCSSQLPFVCSKNL